MELNEYQKMAMRTNRESSDNFTYSICGLVAEVGEVADKVAKARRSGIISICSDNLCPNTETVSNPLIKNFMEGMVKEVGDVLWFVAHIATQLGLSLEEIAHVNLVKLKDRQKRGVIIGNGDNR
uniref:nucleoside triphosphate pyrophosphohydrolase family protein n=1 Tax=Alistipes sp. TaxID=1872444 RepID=UPI004056F037